MLADVGATQRIVAVQADVHFLFGDPREIFRAGREFILNLAEYEGVPDEAAFLKAIASP
jgi:hypothetical protein